MTYELKQLRGAFGAGRAAAENAAKDNSTLVGKFFLCPRRGKPLRSWGRGRIISQQADGVFLVQIYSWLINEPTLQKLESAEQMGDWEFYQGQEEWCEASRLAMEQGIEDLKEWDKAESDKGATKE